MLSSQLGNGLISDSGRPGFTSQLQPPNSYATLNMSETLVPSFLMSLIGLLCGSYELLQMLSPSLFLHPLADFQLPTQELTESTRIKIEPSSITALQHCGWARGWDGRGRWALWPWGLAFPHLEQCHSDRSGSGRSSRPVLAPHTSALSCCTPRLGREMQTSQRKPDDCGVWTSVAHLFSCFLGTYLLRPRLFRWQGTAHTGMTLGRQ